MVSFKIIILWILHCSLECIDFSCFENSTQKAACRDFILALVTLKTLPQLLLRCTYHLSSMPNPSLLAVLLVPAQSAHICLPQVPSRSPLRALFWFSTFWPVFWCFHRAWGMGVKVPLRSYPLNTTSPGYVFSGPSLRSCASRASRHPMLATCGHVLPIVCDLEALPKM